MSEPSSLPDAIDDARGNVSTRTKDSMIWFQQRRQQWLSSPRAKIRDLGPPLPSYTPTSHSYPTQNDLDESVAFQKCFKASSSSDAASAPAALGAPETTSTPTPAGFTSPQPSGATTSGERASDCRSNFSFGKQRSRSSLESSPRLFGSPHLESKTTDWASSAQKNSLGNGPANGGFSGNEIFSFGKVSASTGTTDDFETGQSTVDSRGTLGLGSALGQMSIFSGKKEKLVFSPEPTLQKKEIGKPVAFCVNEPSDRNGKESGADEVFRPPKNATLDSRALSYRDQLVAFYQKHNPSKIDSVEATLRKYAGKEEIMLQKLRAKYEPLPDGFLEPSGTGPICYLEFNQDRVTVQLFADKTPLAAENFRSLCTGETPSLESSKPLCYRNSIVHRVVPNFCIQAGDFTNGDGTGGRSIYPTGLAYTDMWGKFKDEMPFLKHSRKGLLSMANNGPNQNGSQFFITLRALPHLNGKHVVFGEVIEGMNVVESVGSLATDAKQRPTDVTVLITDCGEIKMENETNRELFGNTQAESFLKGPSLHMSEADGQVSSKLDGEFGDAGENRLESVCGRAKAESTKSIFKSCMGTFDSREIFQSVQKLQNSSN